MSQIAKLRRPRCLRLPLSTALSVALLFAPTGLSAADSVPLPFDADAADIAQAPTLLRWWDQTEDLPESDPNEPLATDRPDFTEASSTVGAGTLQLEMGYTFTSDAGGADRLDGHSYPEALFRYGVFADWLELRLGQNIAAETAAGTTEHGAEDLYLGFKFALTTQSGVLPEVALVPQITVPTGSRAFTGGESLPGVNLLYGWDVNDFISTAGSTQFNRAIDADTGHDFTEWAQSWTVGYTLTEQLGAYTEWFAFFPHSADTVRPQHYLDGGFAYRFTTNIQWDIRGGVGLNEAADDYFAGTGLSIRWR